MDPFTLAVVLFLGAVLAGYIGSLLGLGGGFLLVPLMTIALGIDILTAVAISIVGVVATSTGAGAASVRRGLANTRLGMFLEVATTLGAIAGAGFALQVGRDALALLFGVALFGAVPFMLRPLRPPATNGGSIANGISSAIDRVLPPSHLRLSGHYQDSTGTMRPYSIHRPAGGFALSAFAGVISGLLGIGGGMVKVPAMRGVMGAPIQVAIGTSNFMIGVTASAAALVYFSIGAINLPYAATAALGVFAGTRLGTRRAEQARPETLAKAFAVALVVIGISMVLKGARVIP